MNLNLKIISIFSIIFLMAIVIGSASAAPVFAIGPETTLGDQIGLGCAAPSLDENNLDMGLDDSRLDSAANSTQDDKLDSVSSDIPVIGHFSSINNSRPQYLPVFSKDSFDNSPFSHRGIKQIDIQRKPCLQITIEQRHSLHEFIQQHKVIEPKEIEHMSIRPVIIEPIDIEPIDIEPIDIEPIDIEPVASGYVA